MDEEDEFGDLYTDVLSTFPFSTTASPLDPVESNPVNDTSPNSNKFPDPQPPPPPPPPPPPEIDNNSPLQDQEDDIGPVIPGLHGTATINDNSDSSSDSDSDDGLQIVLNETEPLSNHHQHPNGSFDDDDDDVDDLQIVADDPGAPNDEPDWGDDKDPTDPSKPPPSAPPRPNYPPPYNSFHSHFKYVRPGVAQGSCPVQPRPPLNVSLIGGGGGGGGGRGRGDFKGPPINKPSFHPSGFWGAAAPPRGFDFTLPSHKSVLPKSLLIFFLSLGNCFMALEFSLLFIVI